MIRVHDCGAFLAVPPQHGVRADRRHRPAGFRIGGHSLLGDRGSEADPDSAEPGLAADALDHGLHRLRQPRRRRELSRDRELRACLTLTPLRDALAISLVSRQAADDNADEEKEQQVQELLRRRHGERVARLDEEQVVDEESAERGDDGRQGPPSNRHDGDGDEIDR